MPKVLVGMSGGVDSSVTAYLLKEQGYDVEGLSFILWEARGRTDFTTCCSLQAIDGAAQTASQLGVKHSSIDVRDDFIEKVIEPFIDAYTKGMTPNPCILCNKYIKFPFLLREADKIGAEFIATGHYARVEQKGSEGSSFAALRRMDQRVKGSKFLKKGVDPKKDQSYFLYVIRKQEIERLLLPLGDYRKDEVRKIAQGLDLPSAQRPESQEICFIEGRDYFNFIDKLSPLTNAAGPVINMQGKVLGEHKGIYHYTIGQRKGLGVASLEPLYVVKIDAEKNIVYVGSQEDAKMREFEVFDLNWLTSPILSSVASRTDLPRRGEGEVIRATVKVRSMMKPEPATIHIIDEESLRVVFDEPQWAPAPGQSAVFYDKDIVIAGGVIR